MMCLCRRASLRRDASKTLVTGCDPQGRSLSFPHESKSSYCVPPSGFVGQMNKAEGRMADGDQKGKCVLCSAASTVLEKRDPRCFRSEARTDTRASERD